MFYFFIRSFFWRELLKEKDENFRLSFSESSYLWTISELKRFAPGNVWSFIGRIMAFSQKGIVKKTTTALLLTESEFLVIGALGISIFALSFIFKNFLPIYLNTKFIYLIGLLLMLVLPIVFISAKYALGLPLIKKFKIFRIIVPNFTFKTNFKFLLISYLYSAVFGIGTFLTVSSVMYINPTMFLTLTGFFIFAFIVGYISFVTPMGLGVREAVMILGLVKITSLNTAGLAAIFTRIVFIVSELIVFLLVLIWKHTNIKLLTGIENWIKSNKYKSALMLLVIFYCLYFISASILRYQNFYTGRFDLGNMDQTVWNTLHGRIFELTDPNATNIVSRLSFHADFILILLAPFYILWQDPRMLLILQTLIIAVGAFFVYALGQKVIKNDCVSFVLSIGYLLYPGLNYVNLYDFHPVALASTFLLAAFYFLFNKKYTGFIIFALLSALTKEEIWLTLGLFGLYIFFAQKRRLLGALLFTASVFVFYYLIWIAIPAVKGSQHFALSYYSDFGQSPTEIVKNIIIQPEKTFRIVLNKNRLVYLLELFSPVGFLCLFSPLFLFAAPDLMINTLSSNPALYQLYYQYTAVITPFVFISAIFGLSNLKRIFPKIPNYLYVALLAGAIASTSYLIGPMPWSKNANITMFTKPVKNRSIVYNFISDIPVKYSIAATNNLGSHLSHRQKIYTIPIGIDKADIIMFLLNDPYAKPSLEGQKKIANKMKQDKNYIEVFKEDDFIVFEKRNLYLLTRPEIRQAKLFPFSIPSLINRDYIGGEIKIEKLTGKNRFYKTYDINYPSDGLNLHGLMTIPDIPQPAKGFPVLILMRGYQNPADYNSALYNEWENYFASKGFLVIKPDYRGYSSSEIDYKSLSYLAYPIDVVNLISSLKNLKNADSNSIYLFGDSFGADVTLKVLEIAGNKPELSNSIKKAVVESPAVKPFEQLRRSKRPYLVSLYNDALKTIGSPNSNSALWQSLRPLSYLVYIKTPLLIEQGTTDNITPYQESIELYNDLISLNKTAKLIIYTNADHNLSKERKEAQNQALGFFNN